MHIEQATSQNEWDDFLLRQRFRPFLQSWTMGEVYRDTEQEPIRLVAREDRTISGICQAVVVPARRGRHLSVPYGPILRSMDVFPLFLEELSRLGREHRCLFIRISPHWLRGTALPDNFSFRKSPLHLLSEEGWYIPLRQRDPWQQNDADDAPARSEDDLLMSMRKTTRNLIRRAEKDGVTVRASQDPMRDLTVFLRLHQETKMRHGFTPYREAFFRAQVARFAPRGECTVYLAEHQGEVLATSIHMHLGGETSYHHGASTMSKVPASYLLQWQAIRDALRRNDRVYNFWGIAPRRQRPDGEWELINRRHPFAGVTLFKTGFGGTLLPLEHCMDLPLSPAYLFTRAFEFVRKWRRGF